MLANAATNESPTSLYLSGHAIDLPQQPPHVPQHPRGIGLAALKRVFGLDQEMVVEPVAQTEAQPPDFRRQRGGRVVEEVFTQVALAGETLDETPEV